MVRSQPHPTWRLQHRSSDGTISLEFRPVRSWQYMGLMLAAAAIGTDLLLSLLPPLWFNPGPWILCLMVIGLGLWMALAGPLQLAVDDSRQLTLTHHLGPWVWKRQRYPLERVRDLRFQVLVDSEDGPQDILTLELAPDQTLKLLNLYQAATPEQRAALQLLRDRLPPWRG